MAKVSIFQAPVGTDSAAEVPRQKWGDLLWARRQFCQQYLAKDCRNLVFFITDGAANKWVGLGSRERYIREGLGLDPEVVDWAVAGLAQMRPDEVAGLDKAILLGKHGGDRRAKRKGQGSGTTLMGRDAKWIKARLKRDGFTEELAQIERGEITPNAAGLQTGILKPLVRFRPTVEGYAKSIKGHLDRKQIKQLIEVIA
jgi:hypothetical protein